jgi:hypothetical protein
MAMNDAERGYIGRLLREGAKKDRGYASFFDSSDGAQKEVGVVLALFESLLHCQGEHYYGLRARGQSNDPPDCEAVDSDGHTLGIEVTELVDPIAIHKYKRGPAYQGRDDAGGQAAPAPRQVVREKDGRPA